MRWSDHEGQFGNDFDSLSGFLAETLDGGEGLDVLRRVEEGKYRPSKKLLEHVGKVIKGVPSYVLLDEQLVVYETVRAQAREGFHDRRKTVILVRGGPGTGKSVIAINLLADLSIDGRNAHYATGSRAFTETLRKVVGSRAGVQVKYFNSYEKALPDEIDILICDEAHRIRAIAPIAAARAVAARFSAQSIPDCVGRKRRTPAARMARRGSSPSRLRRLAKSIITSASFTTTPDKATIPIKLS